MKVFMTLLIIFLNFSICFAEDSDNTDSINLEQIVITPYKTSIPQRQIGTSVDVLDINEQYNKGNYSLASALGSNTSVMAVKTGGIGGDTSIFLRGNNSYHTRFLLDGIKLYDPLLTQAYYNSAHFYLNGVDNVEISKGQQSSLYGSDAIAGVINISTKKASEPFLFTYLQEFGRYYTYTEQFDLENKNEKLGYVLSVLRTDSEGFSSTQEKEGNYERDPYHNTNVSLRADYDVNEDIAIGFINRFIYANYEYDGSDPTTWLPADDNDRHSRNYEDIGTVFLEQMINDIFKQRLQLGYTRFYRQYFDDTDSTIDDWYDSKTYQLEWKLNGDINDFYKFVLGTDYLREKGDYYSPSGDFPKQTLNNKGIYLENIITPLEDIFLSFSYRRDEHSSFGGQDSKGAGFSYLIEKTATKLKFSYGEGFKAPSMYQLYAPASAWGPIGNIDLSSEQSKTYEMGIEQNIRDNIKVRTTYFRTFFRNLIDFVSGTGYTNVSKARIYGIETDFEYLINPNFNLNFGYTWLDTENKENHAQLERRPENKVNIGLKGVFNNWETDFGLSYVGHRTQGTSGNTLLKPYLLLNASCLYHWSKNTDLFLRGENLLDKNYELIDHYQVKRLSFYCGVKTKF